MHVCVQRSTFVRPRYIKPAISCNFQSSFFFSNKSYFRTTLILEQVLFSNKSFFWKYLIFAACAFLSFENCCACMFTSVIFPNKSCFLHEVFLSRLARHTSVPCCTYTRASFVVEKLVRLAGSLLRKNYARVNKTCRGKLVRDLRLQVHS